MEAIVILIADFLGVALAPLISLIVEAVVAMVALIAHGVQWCGNLAAAAFGTTKPSTAQGSPPSEPSSGKSASRAMRGKILKWLAAGLGGIFVLSLVAVAAMQWLFFEGTLRWMLNRAEQRTGISIEFAQASGSFFAGRFEFRDVKVVREKHAESRFALRVEHCRIEVPIRRLFASPTPVTLLALSGIDGEFQRVNTPQSVKTRKPFVIEDLQIERASLRVIDLTKEGQPRFALSVDRWEAAPFRSRWAIFDVLFRSNASGTIEGRSFEIVTVKSPNGRKTRWAASELPAPFLAQMIGGPLRYFQSGTVDVLVEDEWALAESASIELTWRLMVKDFQAQVPTPPVMTVLMDRTLVAWLGQRGRDVDFSFRLAMNEGEFISAASLDAVGFWDRTLDGFAHEIARRAGVQPEKVRDTIDTGAEAFRNYLDRRRKGDSSQEKD